MRSGLEAGYQLDRLWYAMQGLRDHSKQPALMALARVMQASGVPYAVIGGVALQIHQKEPRTTLDIDLAVRERSAIPRAALEAAGFHLTGSFAHSENWEGPEAVPVQITDDPALREAIGRADIVRTLDVELRVLCRADLLREKLRAGSDPARRRSKRMQDLADAQALVEDDPGLIAGLSDAERARLERLL